MRKRYSELTEEQKERAKARVNKFRKARVNSVNTALTEEGDTMLPPQRRTLPRPPPDPNAEIQNLKNQLTMETSSRLALEARLGELERKVTELTELVGKLFELVQTT